MTEMTALYKSVLIFQLNIHVLHVNFSINTYVFLFVNVKNDIQKKKNDITFVVN